MKTVRLGFEIPTGKPVELPLRHMVVTGQTQEAGKTTTLEALITRAGVKAVAFITKRGEGSFAQARTIRPYFREQADWKYVAAILEASRGEKLKFERSWIIRASKGARTLADVHRNVRRLLADPKTKGINADVYLTLDAYLEDVVPQISRVRWAETVELAAGINAMDLGALNIEMQHLVIRSTIEWVLQHAEDTVVVVPEAWKFIPQGRGTPVKLAAEAFIRQAAALRNYLWLDSQDIAGIEKLILKSVPVWILGVQREINEVKRTLEQMPVALPKLTPRQVATLKLGEFYACYGEHAIKTYVQPAWMDEGAAQTIATSDMDEDDRRIFGGTGRNPPRGVIESQPLHTSAVPPAEEDEVNKQEARALREENDELRRRVGDLEQLLQSYGNRVEDLPAAPMPKSAPRTQGAAPETNGHLDEGLYQAIKQRLTADTPHLLRVLVLQPEIEIEVRHETVTADGASWVGRTARLIKDGFFDSPRKSAEVFREALRHGATGVAPRADEACKKLLVMGFLTREEEGFRAVKGMKVNIVGAR